MTIVYLLLFIFFIFLCVFLTDQYNHTAIDLNVRTDIKKLCACTLGHVCQSTCLEFFQRKIIVSVTSNVNGEYIE